MEKKIYLCPGNNPNHWASQLTPKKPCTRDYEHGIVRGSRGTKYFECNNSDMDLEPTFTNEKRHSCNINAPYDGYGVAVEHCNEDDSGRLWVGNGEYGSMVNYCPQCGFKGKPYEL